MHGAFAFIADSREEELGSPEQEQPWERLQEWPQEWHGGNAIVEGRTKNVDGHVVLAAAEAALVTKAKSSGWVS